MINKSPASPGKRQASEGEISNSPKEKEEVKGWMANNAVPGGSVGIKCGWASFIIHVISKLRGITILV